MIEYIINNASGCLVFQNGTSIQNSKTNLGYVKQLCMDNLFTYEGYLKSVRYLFNKHYLIPVYVNEIVMLIPTKRVRDYENIWINYQAIENIKSTTYGVCILFFSKIELNINLKIETLQKQIQYLKEIRNHKVKHFHF